MRNFSTDAIVLRVFKVGEKDLLVRFLTSEFGKILCNVKGIRSFKNKYGSIEIFSKQRIGLYRVKSSGRNLLTDNKILESNYNIRKDIDKFMAASFVLDSVDKMTEIEDSSSRELFNLLDTTLKILDTEPMGFIIEWFLIRFLDITGHGLVFDKCSACGISLDKNIKLKSITISPCAGGIVCNNCKKDYTKTNIDIPAALFDILRILKQTNDYEEVKDLYLKNKNYKERAEYAIKKIVNYFK